MSTRFACWREFDKIFACGGDCHRDSALLFTKVHRIITFIHGDKLSVDERRRFSTANERHGDKSMRRVKQL